jgi:hypothetical protein
VERAQTVYHLADLKTSEDDFLQSVDDVRPRCVQHMSECVPGLGDAERIPVWQWNALFPRRLCQNLTEYAESMPRVQDTYRR